MSGQAQWEYSGPVIPPGSLSHKDHYGVFDAPENRFTDYTSEEHPVTIRIDDPQVALLPVKRWDLGRAAFFRQAFTRRPDTIHFQTPQDGRHGVIPVGALTSPLQAQEAWGITPRTRRNIPGAWDAGTELS